MSFIHFLVSVPTPKTSIILGRMEYWQILRDDRRNGL
jgi:hypothetical protein